MGLYRTGGGKSDITATKIGTIRNKGESFTATESGVYAAFLAYASSSSASESDITTTGEVIVKDIYSQDGVNWTVLFVKLNAGQTITQSRSSLAVVNVYKIS